MAAMEATGSFRRFSSVVSLYFLYVTVYEKIGNILVLIGILWIVIFCFQFSIGLDD